MPSPPRLRGRCRPSPVTGRGTVRTTNGSEPRTPRRVCHRRAWNRPYRREAAPVLPVDTLRDWLGIRYDAGNTVVFDCVAGCTARIPALKGEALRLFHVNRAVARALYCKAWVGAGAHPGVRDMSVLEAGASPRPSSPGTNARDRPVSAVLSGIERRPGGGDPRGLPIQRARYCYVAAW
jgi:hypothetical protein